MQFDDHGYDDEWFQYEKRNLDKLYGENLITVIYSQGEVGYLCELCSTECTSRNYLHIHCIGKKHIKKKSSIDVRLNHDHRINTDHQNLRPLSPRNERSITPHQYEYHHMPKTNEHCRPPSNEHCRPPSNEHCMPTSHEHRPTSHEHRPTSHEHRPTSHEHYRPISNEHYRPISNEHYRPRTNEHYRPRTNEHYRPRTNEHYRPRTYEATEIHRREYNSHSLDTKPERKLQSIDKTILNEILKIDNKLLDNLGETLATVQNNIKQDLNTDSGKNGNISANYLHNRSQPYSDEPKPATTKISQPLNILSSAFDLKRETHHKNDNSKESAQIMNINNFLSSLNNPIKANSSSYDEKQDTYLDPKHGNQSGSPPKIAFLPPAPPPPSYSSQMAQYSPTHPLESPKSSRYHSESPKRKHSKSHKKHSKSHKRKRSHSPCSNCSDLQSTTNLVGISTDDIMKLCQHGISTEKDVTMGINTTSFLIKSMREHFYKSGNHKMTEMMMEVELKLGAAKSSRAGCDMGLSLASYSKVFST